MKRVILLLLAGLWAAFMVSCQKGEMVAEETDMLVNQEVVVENLMAEIDMLVNGVVESLLSPLKSAGVSGVYAGNDCPVIQYDRTSVPRVIVMDFGSGCKGPDGKMRSGKIIIKASSFENLVTNREKTFENFTIENRKIEGKITQTVTLNRENHIRIAKVTENVSVTFADGSVVLRKADMTREHQLGVLTDRLDDKIISWGEITISKADGRQMVKTINETKPLVFLASCRQTVSGVVNYSQADGQSWQIDYGQGECDDIAEVTRNGIVKVIRIRK